MKCLYLVRGVSGSGKTTVANSFGEDCHVWSADDFFMDTWGLYDFDASKLSEAHEWCQNQVEGDMEYGRDRIAVANTFTRKWEMEAYYKLAEEHGYIVFSIIVENRHGGTNEHGVPEDKVQGMRDRFEVKL